MANEGAGTSGERFDAGGGPQTLAQLQGTGAEVFGSDGEKVGDLKIVGDAEIVVGRRLLKSDLHVPIRHVKEATADGEVVLDVSAEEAQEIQSGGAATDTSDPEGFSQSEKLEKGALGLVRDDSQETK